MKRALGVASALLLLSGTGAAQEGHTVRGVVVDAASGGPIAGALVSLRGGREALTDGDGRFVFCRLPAEPLGLTARATGYVREESPAPVVPGDTAPVRVALRRPVPGVVSGVVIREGGGPGHPGALVFVDGVRVFHSWSGCEDAPRGVPMLASIDPGEVDGVVVVKGREAVRTYGPEAEHGALVVTTKRKAGRPAS